MNIKETIAHKSNYGDARNLTTIKYIVIHYTGNDGDTDEGNTNYFQTANRGASAHYFVDDDSVSRSVPDNYVAWHCGAKTYYHSACRNANSIGVEMCDNVKDGTYKLSNTTKANVIELVKSLMDKYNIPIENVVRHYDVTHKLCPAYFVDNAKWNAFKAEITSTPSQSSTPTSTVKTNLTSIIGASNTTASQMINYIKSVNSKISQSVIDMIPYYISEGEAEGIRGEIAFAQSCIETGNFAFSDTAVKISQNNFCGLGVTTKGMTGNSFATPQLGIRAQIQHLKAYATSEALRQSVIDPRYKYVTKGCAPYIEWLGIQENPSKVGWAAGINYGSKILAVMKKVNSSSTSNFVEKSENETIKVVSSAPTPISSETYRIRKSWADAKSQLGAFSSLDNAKKDLKDGYSIYNNKGEQVYSRESQSSNSQPTSQKEYKVRVTTPSLRIRKEANADSSQAGSITDKGVYTIIETEGNWGFLKSKVGWICLDYTAKI